MKKVLTRNVPMKILSFLIAVIVWVVIMNISDPYIISTIDNIKVEMINTSAVEEENKMYEVNSGEYVTIKIRGKRSIIDSLLSNNFNAVADFNEMSLVYAVPIHVSAKASSKYTMDDIEILEQTQMMTLSLEDMDTRTSAVKVIPVGTAKEGYYVTDMIANPHIIEITGSEKMISRIKDVVVEVNIDYVSNSYQVIAVPKVYDENGYVLDSSKLEFQTTEILVDTTVLPTKEIEIIMSTTGTPSYGYHYVDIVFEPKKITIAGEQKELDKIYWIKDSVDISGKKETFQEDRDIEAILYEKYPDTYHVVGTSKSLMLTTIIEKLESKEIIVKMSDLIVKNMSEEHEVLYRTQGSITLRVMGVAEALENLSIETLNPYIDLGEYELGAHTVIVNCDLSDDSITVRPITISVELINKGSSDTQE